jgi:hypothetical protein
MATESVPDATESARMELAWKYLMPAPALMAPTVLSTPLTRVSIDATLDEVALLKLVVADSALLTRVSTDARLLPVAEDNAVVADSALLTRVSTEARPDVTPEATELTRLSREATLEEVALLRTVVVDSALLTRVSTDARLLPVAEDKAVVADSALLTRVSTDATDDAVEELSEESCRKFTASVALVPPATPVILRSVKPSLTETAPVVVTVVPEMPSAKVAPATSATEP